MPEPRWCKKCKVVFCADACPASHANFMYTKKIPEGVDVPPAAPAPVAEQEAAPGPAPAPRKKWTRPTPVATQPTAGPGALTFSAPAPSPAPTPLPAEEPGAVAGGSVAETLRRIHSAGATSVATESPSGSGRGAAQKIGRRKSSSAIGALANKLNFNPAMMGGPGTPSGTPRLPGMGTPRLPTPADGGGGVGGGGARAGGATAEEAEPEPEPAQPAARMGEEAASGTPLLTTPSSARAKLFSSRKRGRPSRRKKLAMVADPQTAAASDLSGVVTARLQAWQRLLGAAAVASFLAAVLTEICLCNVCSCHEVLRRNGRGQAPTKPRPHSQRRPRPPPPPPPPLASASAAR
jgi:hypothetical protein